ncbi:MAG: CoA pyrophosphatase [Anaerolineales bacterium]|nr:CoA pyrophosphatase [Anaerolineales bacterium]
MNLITAEVVRQALALTDFDVVTAQEKMAPRPRPRVRPASLAGQARQGAVLLLLYHKEAALHAAFVRRPMRMSNHPGQIAFPGGQQEAGEAFVHTAVRETEEEVGIPPANLTLLGQLHPIYIPPSDFEVYPFVAWHTAVPRFQPDPREVDEVLEVPLHPLLRPESRGYEERQLMGRQIGIPYFWVDEAKGDKIWGGTAVILSEFLERLRVVIG